MGAAAAAAGAVASSEAGTPQPPAAPALRTADTQPRTRAAAQGAARETSHRGTCKGGQGHRNEDLGAVKWFSVRNEFRPQEGHEEDGTARRAALERNRRKRPAEMDGLDMVEGGKAAGSQPGRPGAVQGKALELLRALRAAGPSTQSPAE